MQDVFDILVIGSYVIATVKSGSANVPRFQNMNKCQHDPVKNNCIASLSVSDWTISEAIDACLMSGIIVNSLEH